MTTETKSKTKDPTPDSVASPAENAKLEHTAGGKTTRDDPLDAGVPMTQGDPREPIGPEDALGPGPKRGDYSGRIDAGPHLVSEPIPPGEREDVILKDDDGNVIGREPGPHTRLVDAGARAGDVGDAPGKGGVPPAPGPGQVREDLALPPKDGEPQK
jgi:hypothetical protein